MSQNQNTQSKYRKNRNPTEQPKIEDNEVRITTQGRVKKYVDYSLRLLQGSDINQSNQRNQQHQQGVDKSEEKESHKEEHQHKEDKSSPQHEEHEHEHEHDDTSKEQKHEEEHVNVEHIIKKFDTIVLKATGLAINKAVITAEVVKRRIGGLHQVTDLKTLEIEDTWEPVEEGLHVVKTTRRVASIIIKLSCDNKEIEKIRHEPGYQAPIANESIKPGSGRRTGGFISGQQGGQGNYGGGNRYRSGSYGYGYGGQNRFQGRRGGGGFRGGFRGGNNNNNNYRQGGGGGGGGYRQGSPNRGQNQNQGQGQGNFRGGGGGGQGYRGGGQGGYRQGGGGGGGGQGQGQGGPQRRGGFRGGGQGFRGGRGGNRGGGGQFRGGGMRQQQGVRNF